MKSIDNEIIKDLNLTEISLIINGELRNSNLNRQNNFFDLANFLGKDYKNDLNPDEIRFTLDNNIILDNKFSLNSAGIDESTLVRVEYSPYSVSNSLYCELNKQENWTTVKQFNLTSINKITYIRGRCIENIKNNVKTILELLTNSIDTDLVINIYEENAIQNAIETINIITNNFLDQLNGIVVKIEKNRREIIKRRNK